MQSKSSTCIAFCIFLAGLICGTGSTITIKVIAFHPACTAFLRFRRPTRAFVRAVPHSAVARPHTGGLRNVERRHRWDQQSVRETADHHLGEPAAPTSRRPTLLLTRFVASLVRDKVMFLAMAFALPIHHLCRCFFGRSPGEDMETVMVDGKLESRPLPTPTKVTSFFSRHGRMVVRWLIPMCLARYTTW